MNFDWFRKARNEEIPLIGEMVAPASRRDRCVEALFHQQSDFLGLGIGEKIDIAAKIGPMIEGLHHHDLISAILECGTNLMQTKESRGDPCLFRRKSAIRQLKPV